MLVLPMTRAADMGSILVACDYHCRIINEIRSIRAHSGQPVGAALARLKTLISFESFPIGRHMFPVHHVE